MLNQSVQISVIVPAYNAALYLQHCLDSLLKQTVSGLEIIVIDDGSSDDTPAILRGYTARATQIRVFRQANSGVSIARNNGLAQARGEFVAFMDVDDIAEPTLYADMLARARRDALDIVLCNAWVHCFDGSAKLLFPAKDESAITSGEHWVAQAVAAQAMRHYIWCHLYRHDFLLENRLQFAPSITHQDIVWTNAAMIAARRVAHINCPLYHYIKRDGSLSKPANAQGQLTAARHYMSVALLLEGLTWTLAPGTSVFLAVESQLVSEGVVVFQLARQLPVALRRILFIELHAKAHLQTLARHASTLSQKRRLWKHAFRYNIFCAIEPLRKLWGAIIEHINSRPRAQT